MKLKHLVLGALLSCSGLSIAAVIPVGIQTSVTDTQIANWGWTECSRSSVTDFSSTSAVVSACQGDYVAMGVWNASAGNYAVVGMGEFDIVTRVLYLDDFGDDDGTIQNWSNGLNWYRTAGIGSWGFTTAAETALAAADYNLENGLQDYDEYGTNETTLAAGLSFHIDFTGDFFEGWGFNPTGMDFEEMEFGDERVFWVANREPTEVPEPTSLALLGVGALALLRRRIRK